MAVQFKGESGINGSADQSVAAKFKRESRAQQLRDIIGKPNPKALLLTKALRNTAYRHYNRYILPLILQHWPEVLDSGLEKKIRYLTCDYYAAAAYTMLFVAPKPPLLIRLLMMIANRLPLPVNVLGGIACFAMMFLGRWVYRDKHKRIIFLAAFSPIADHAIEHCMNDIPIEERAELMHGILDKIAYKSSDKWRAKVKLNQPEQYLKIEKQEEIKTDRSPLKLTEAIFAGCAENLLVEEDERFSIAYGHVKDWIESEIMILTDTQDPTGMKRRLAGIKAQIDALCIPTDVYVTEQIRTWGYTVGIFVQMIDDWIDFDDDLELNKLTPVVSGHWTLPIISEQLEKSIEEFKTIIIASGRQSPHYINMLIDTYTLFTYDLMEAMINRIAD